MTVFGQDVKTESKTIKESVGYVPEEWLFNENITALKLFKNTLKAHNLLGEDEMDNIVNFFNFDKKLKISNMNDREKSIMSIINALISKPKLLILDNVQTNLEDSDMDLLFSYINNIKEEPMTVLYLTDSLVLAQKYCDRAGYLYDGMLKESEYLKTKPANDKIIRIFSEIEDLRPLINAGAKIVKDEVGEKTLYYRGNMKLLSNVIATCAISNYSIENASLEDRERAFYINPAQNNISEGVEA